MTERKHWNAYSERWLTQGEQDKVWALSKQVAHFLVVENHLSVSDAKYTLGWASVAVSGTVDHIE